ncbi:MAG TPA: VTT domain-containing protein [Propionibacteriaceae bacterium]|nr:VTT domain-containing protein [Propionibacteriaceae bacterium]
MTEERTPDQTPEPGSYPFPAPEVAGAAAVEKEWWDDPGMPWRQKPTRSDIACLSWIGFMGIFGLVMLPLRAWLLGLDPAVLVALTGSRSGSAALGALHSVGASPWWWWLALVAGILMSIKFDWIFWWAGKLWGHGMIEVWGGRSERAKRNYDRVTRWAEKWGAVGIFLAYIPIPLPLMQVVFVMAGASKMSLKKFMMLDFLATMTWLALYFILGFAVGEPAVAALKAYAKVSMYVAMGLIVFIMGSYYWNARKKQQA